MRKAWCLYANLEQTDFCPHGAQDKILKQQFLHVIWSIWAHIMVRRKEHSLSLHSLCRVLLWYDRCVCYLSRQPVDRLTDRTLVQLRRSCPPCLWCWKFRNRPHGLSHPRRKERRGIKRMQICFWKRSWFKGWTLPGYLSISLQGTDDPRFAGGGGGGVGDARNSALPHWKQHLSGDCTGQWGTMNQCSLNGNRRKESLQWKLERGCISL